MKLAWRRRIVYPAALAYDSSSRAELIQTLRQQQAALSQLQLELEGSDPTAKQLAQEEALADRVLDLRHLYREMTPVVPISRCPYTGIEVTYAVDIFGLDGPWWDYDDPLRPSQAFPATLFALAGGIDLAGEVEPAPQTVFPGPGAPYVVPRLLEPTDTAAVLSSIPIGEHTAFVIGYYSQTPGGDYPLLNEWGTGRWLRRHEQPASWDRAPLILGDCDFNLDPWIESGRLLWIEPSDGSLELHIGPDGCPYLGHTGEQSLAALYQGVVA